MFHIELRQFPHSAWRFNLSQQELSAVLEPWLLERAVEVGERKWSPHTAKITILEGPKLEVAQLSMGRGWRAAQRQSEDVTERMLAAGGESPAPAQAAPAAVAVPEPVEPGLAALLGPNATALLDVWRAVVAASPGLAPSESLARAERAIGSAGGDQG
jgi:hypothetical protein